MNSRLKSRSWRSRFPVDRKDNKPYCHGVAVVEFSLEVNDAAAT